MNKIKSAFLMLTICLLGLSACKKDKGETAEGSFSAKVDGTTKTAAAPSAIFYAGENTVQIAGLFTTTTGISITIVAPKVGTFNVAGEDVLVAYLPTNDEGTAYFGSSGKVTVTEWTESRIKGTFEFTGELLLSPGTVTVSEGKFDVKVTKM